MRLSLSSFALTISAMMILSCSTKQDSGAPRQGNTPNQTVPKQPQYKAFGDSVQSAQAPMTLAEAIKSPNKNTIVRVHAIVQEVCQKKGCWMTLSDGTHLMRVTFKDYGFFVPKDIVGKTIIAEGIIAEEILSEEDARHYAEDAGKSKEEILKIKGNQKTITMEAQSVFVLM